jgi:hypothetical protein
MRADVSDSLNVNSGLVIDCGVKSLEKPALGDHRDGR